MTREEARRQTFARDHGRCVFCHKEAVDAHHVLERRLWDDDGYHLDNLISVCYTCHVLCERTVYSVEEGRERAGITRVCLPDHLYSDVCYDKWGNPFVTHERSYRWTRPLRGDRGEPLWEEYIPRGQGELFWDEGVQKILEPVMSDFTGLVKYPRTYHLPWSYASKDDRTIASTNIFEGKQIVVTEKMDGENTTLYTNYMHARSLDSNTHPSRTWMKAFWARMGHEIPYDMRVCGENLYATHSIAYDNLENYFMAFSIWEKDLCLDWDNTQEWFALLGLTSVPVLYEGVYDEALLRKMVETLGTNVEGYVVRVRESFSLRQFRHSVAKYVRKNHITTDGHWRNNFIQNTLKEGNL